MRYDILVDHIIGWFVSQDDKGNLERLMIFKLLDYKYQSIGRLYTTIVGTYPNT